MDIRMGRAPLYTSETFQLDESLRPLNMVAVTFAPSQPLPSATRPSKEVRYTSPVGLAVGAARRFSSVLPHQWQYSFDKDGSLASVDLAGGKLLDLPQWAGQTKTFEGPTPNQFGPGGFSFTSTRGFEDAEHIDPFKTTPSLLPSFAKPSALRSEDTDSARSSMSDLYDTSCQAADILSLSQGSLLLDLHNCRNASKLGCSQSQNLLIEQQRQRSQSLLEVTQGRHSTIRPRRKSSPRRFLGTDLEEAPRQLSILSSIAPAQCAPITPPLQAPGWKQADEYFFASNSGTDHDGEASDEDDCFTDAQLERICAPFDRRPSHVAELESLRPAGGVGLDGRARAMSHPFP